MKWWGHHCYKNAKKSVDTLITNRICAIETAIQDMSDDDGEWKRQKCLDHNHEVIKDQLTMIQKKFDSITHTTWRITGMSTNISFVSLYLHLWSSAGFHRTTSSWFLRGTSGDLPSRVPTFPARSIIMSMTVPVGLLFFSRYS